MNDSKIKNGKNSQVFYKRLLRSLLTFFLITTIALIYYLNNKDDKSELDSSSELEISETLTSNSEILLDGYTPVATFPQAYIATFLDVEEVRIPPMVGASAYYYLAQISDLDTENLQVLALFTSENAKFNKISEYQNLLILNSYLNYPISTNPYDSLFSDESVLIYMQDFKLIEHKEIIKLDFQKAK